MLRIELPAKPRLLTHDDSVASNEGLPVSLDIALSPLGELNRFNRHRFPGICSRVRTVPLDHPAEGALLHAGGIRFGSDEPEIAGGCNDRVNDFGGVVARRHQARRGEFRRLSRMRGLRRWQWHLDEMYMKVNGEMIYLWRAAQRDSAPCVGHRTLGGSSASGWEQHSASRVRTRA